MTFSKAQAEALLSVPNENNYRLIRGNGNALNALERAGLCRDVATFRDGTHATLTDAGCAAFVGLLIA